MEPSQVLWLNNGREWVENRLKVLHGVSPSIGSAALTCSAIEVKEAAAGKVHKLLALAVVVEGDLLRLQPPQKLLKHACIHLENPRQRAGIGPQHAKTPKASLPAGKQCMSQGSSLPDMWQAHEELRQAHNTPLSGRIPQGW